jgi:hypothetical protein
MIKNTLAVATFVCGVGIWSVQAQTAAPATPMTTPVTCTQAELTKLDADATKMTDATKKAAAVKEMAMAKDMMAKKDTKGCVTHMDNAMKMMPRT